MATREVMNISEDDPYIEPTSNEINKEEDKTTKEDRKQCAGTAAASTSTSKAASNSEEEQQWVVDMHSILKGDKKLNQVNRTRVCIFQVSNTIIDTKPKAYAPQVLGLGPFHHRRPRLYQMQRCKLSAALKALEDFKLKNFQTVSDGVRNIQQDIRQCYNNYLHINSETLTCIMVIDGLFLLQLMHIKDSSLSLEKEKSYLFEEHTQDEILKDVILLENQIPIIVLEALLKGTQVNSLQDKLVSFCISLLSPLELDWRIALFVSKNNVVEEPCHLLDVVYQLVWNGTPVIRGGEHGRRMLLFPNLCKILWGLFMVLLQILNFAFVQVIKGFVDSILKILDVLGISIDPTKLFSEGEKFIIPRATQLSGIGVKFRPLEDINGIKHIKFSTDTKNGVSPVTLYLPIHSSLDLDLLEVVMRNLLAYEALSMPKSPKFTRYIELMCGLVRRVSDVELLKNTGSNDVYIFPRDADCERIVELFSNLKQVTESKGESELDGTIDKVNEYYNGRPKVKLYKLFIKYFSFSVAVLTFFALVLVVFLMGAQTYCSFYTCPGIIKVKTT